MSPNLEELTPEQVSLAFHHLASGEPPPESLQHLSYLEWVSLGAVLKELLLEKQQSHVH
jgi:hypothetical protein